MKEKDELEEKLQKYFDNMNSVGLGELLLFSDGIEMFIESEARRNRLLRAVVDVCGYDTPARMFVKMISYEEFRKKNTIGEITALGLRLFLLYQCGVDWLK